MGSVVPQFGGALRGPRAVIRGPAVRIRVSRDGQRPMPAALRYTRMGPPTLAAPAARYERAAASKLQSCFANGVLSAVAPA
jgi:hypothetical protein